MATKYYKPLDALRAIAVFFVFAEHMIPQAWKKFRPGAFGVDFFFVLSGFLITGILLGQKQKYDNKEVSLKHVFKSFYVRRALRIFPLYYLVLLLLFIINLDQIRSYILYYLAYLINYIYFFVPANVRVPAAHFWSLSVEEQFYLFWPMVILFVNRKYLIYCILLLLISVPIAEYCLLSSDHGTIYLLLGTSPLGFFYSLGFGALLSVFVNKGKTINKNVLIATGLITLVAYILSYKYVTNYFLLKSLSGYLQALLSGIIILFSISYSGKFLNKIWNNRFLSYSGKISYGLYVYHALIVTIINERFRHFNLYAGKLQIPIFIALTYLISIISWEFYEKRVLVLKSKFYYN
jgi:peptidoglycan/LPS O-acetylase OafA/YrhL